MKFKTKSEQVLDFEKMIKIRQNVLGENYKCDKCYDRGYVGWSEQLNIYIPCVCIIKAQAKIIQQKLVTQVKDIEKMDNKQLLNGEYK